MSATQIRVSAMQEGRKRADEIRWLKNALREVVQENIELKKQIKLIIAVGKTLKGEHGAFVDIRFPAELVDLLPGSDERNTVQEILTG